MFNGNEPINTVQKAKAYFRALGCSHYFMKKEYPDRYNEYILLNIPKRTENEWRIERFGDYYAEILQTDENEDLWRIHNNMCFLMEDIRSYYLLDRMLEATYLIIDRVPPEQKALVSDSINGRSRKDRCGLIYLAYDLGDAACAKKFAKLSMEFAYYSGYEGQNAEKCQSAINNCKEIKTELGLQRKHVKLFSNFKSSGNNHKHNKRPKKHKSDKTFSQDKLPGIAEWNYPINSSLK